jgi:hypothetical protein
VASQYLTDAVYSEEPCPVPARKFFISTEMIFMVELKLHSVYKKLKVG